MRYRQRHTRERPLGFHSETSSVPYRAGLPDRTRHEHGRVQRHRGSAGQERDGLAHPAGRGLQPVRGDREGVLGSPLYCLPALSATPPTDRSRYEGATQEEKRDHGPHHEGPEELSTVRVVDHNAACAVLNRACGEASRGRGDQHEGHPDEYRRSNRWADPPARSARAFGICVGLLHDRPC